MGPIHKSVYWSPKSNKRCSRHDLGPCIPMEVIAGRVPAQDCLHQRHTQHHCRCNFVAWVWLQRQSNSWELPHDESQEKELKTQSETKLDDSFKYLWNLEIDTDKQENLNFVFANHGEEDEIYPLTTIEIPEAQCKDQELKVYYKKNAIMQKMDVCLQLVEDTKVLCKNCKLIIPTSLQHRAVAWYHHYLQHPGHPCLKETMRSVM